MRPSSTTARRRRLTPWSLVAFPTHGARWGEGGYRAGRAWRDGRGGHASRGSARLARRGSCFGGGGAGGRELLPDLHHGRRRHARGSAKAQSRRGVRVDANAPEEASHADARGRQRRAGPSTVPGRALGSGWGHGGRALPRASAGAPACRNAFFFRNAPPPSRKSTRTPGRARAQSLLAKSRNSLVDLRDASFYMRTCTRNVSETRLGSSQHCHVRSSHVRAHRKLL